MMTWLQFHLNIPGPSSRHWGHHLLSHTCWEWRNRQEWRRFPCSPTVSWCDLCWQPCSPAAFIYIANLQMSTLKGRSITSFHWKYLPSYTVELITFTKIQMISHKLASQCAKFHTPNLCEHANCFYDFLCQIGMEPFFHWLLEFKWFSHPPCRE